MDLDIKVSFVIQSEQVSEGGGISCHVNWQSNEVILNVIEKANVMMMKRYIIVLDIQQNYTFLNIFSLYKDKRNTYSQGS